MPKKAHQLVPLVAKLSPDVDYLFEPCYWEDKNAAPAIVGMKTLVDSDTSKIPLTNMGRAVQLSKNTLLGFAHPLTGSVYGAQTKIPLLWEAPQELTTKLTSAATAFTAGAEILDGSD